MHDSRDLAFGRLAMKHRLLTAEQARRCLEEASARGLSLLSVAISHGLIDAPSARRLERELQTSGDTRPDSDSTTPPARLPGMTPIQGSPLSSTAKARLRLEPGEVLGDYVIESQLGEGGMGAVYLARRGDRRFAIKVMTRLDAKAVARFEREARSAAAVDSHPNIVRVHAFVADPARPWLVLDYVEGGALDERLEPGEALPVERIIALTAPIADALAAIHRAGILHRDLKPANILVREEDGAPMLTDFGLARGPDSKTLTASRDVIGTPRYMSPEQASPEAAGKVGPRADIWALGVVLYELATGRRPFEAQSSAELQGQILFADPTPPRTHRRELPRDLETIILCCLQKSPEHRYADAEILAADLRAVGRGEAISASRSGLVTGLTGRIRRRYGAAGLAFSVLLTGLALITAVALPMLALRGRRRTLALRRVGEGLRDLRGELERQDPALSRHLGWTLCRRFVSPPPELPSAEEGLGTIARELEERWAEFRRVRQKALEAGAAAELADRVSDKARARLENRVRLYEFALKLRLEAALPALSDSGAADDDAPPLAAAIAALAAGRPEASVESFRRLIERRADRRSDLRPLAELGLAIAELRCDHPDVAVDLTRRLSASPELGHLARPLHALSVRRDLAARLLDPKASAAELRLTVRRVLETLPEDDKARRREALATLEPRLRSGLAALAEAQGASAAQRVWMRLNGLRESCPGLPSPLPPATVCQALAREADSRGDSAAAFRFYFMARRVEPTFELPEGYRLRDMTRLGYALSQDSRNIEPYFMLLLEASRAEILCWLVTDAWIESVHEQGIIDRELLKAPEDPYIHFWAGLYEPPNGLVETDPERWKAAVDGGIAHLQRVIDHPEVPPAFKAKAYEVISDHHRHYLHYFGEAETRMPIAIKCLVKARALPHPEPDRVLLDLHDARITTLSAEKRLELLEEARACLLDRYRRTLDNRLAEGRAAGRPLAPVFNTNHVRYLAKTDEARARTLLELDRAREALEIVTPSMRLKERLDAFEELEILCLHRLGRLVEARRRLAEAKKLTAPVRRRLEQLLKTS